jgi:hypothetical protein
MTDFERDLHERLHAARLPDAPPALIRALDEIVRTPEPIRHRRSRPIPLLMVAAVIAGTGILVASGAMDPQPSDDQPVPSASAAGLETPTSPPTPTPTSSLAAGIDGLHVYTVSELQSARAARNVSGGPIALRGYWTYLGIPHSCGPPDSTPGELEIYCHDGEYGITERNEPAAVLTKDSRLVPATGPMITPWIPNEDWVVPLVSLLPINGRPFPPVPIVVVGHLDDERAAQCRPKQRQLCRDRFVIDGLVEFEPRAVPTPGVTPTPSPFPFESPPPLSLDRAGCASVAGASDFSFVGWMSGEELASLLQSGITFEVQTLAVSITRDPVKLASREDSDGRHYRLMGRSVCFAHEWDETAVQLDAIKGSIYRLYDDGTVVPTDSPLR